MLPCGATGAGHEEPACHIPPMPQRNPLVRIPGERRQREGGEGGALKRTMMMSPRPPQGPRMLGVHESGWCWLWRVCAAEKGQQGSLSATLAVFPLESSVATHAGARLGRPYDPSPRRRGSVFGSVIVVAWGGNVFPERQTGVRWPGPAPGWTSWDLETNQ